MVESRCWLLLLIALMGHLPLVGQCDQNLLINQGFETVAPPCGNVPPGGLINGSFNQGCMTGWDAAWGTPSVCANNPYEADYYACLGANNEGFFQTLALSPDSTYCLSFYFRRLNGGSGSLDVYLASGLVNQPMSNSGNPPLTIQPSWQVLGSFPSTGNQWVSIVIPNIVQLDPANNQLLFLVNPTSGLDVGVDDVVLSIPDNPDPNVQVEISCTGQTGATITFEGTLNPFPPEWSEAEWRWTFGDGQSGTGETVSHTYEMFGEYEVCLTVFLDCGCQFMGCISFLYDACTCACEPDVGPPQFVNFDPEPITVFCLEDIPEPIIPEIIDCTEGSFVSFEETTSGPSCESVITYTWMASDLCGNTTEVSQVINYINNTTPTFI